MEPLRDVVFIAFGQGGALGVPYVVDFGAPALVFGYVEPLSGVAFFAVGKEGPLGVVFFAVAPFGAAFFAAGLSTSRFTSLKAIGTPLDCSSRKICHHRWESSFGAADGFTSFGAACFQGL